MPCNEPTSLTAGFSAEWTAQVPKEFPSASFSLQYVLRNRRTGGAVQISAVPAGVNSFTVSLLPSATVELEPGQYQLTGYVTDDATGGNQVKQVVFVGQVQILPSPLAEDGDHRTFTQRMVDSLRTAYESLASGRLSSMSVNGKSYTNKSLSEIREELARWEARMAQEDADARGCGNHGKILIRFNPIGQ